MAAAALGGLAGVLVFKEVADFIQVGLIAWQTKQKFSGRRATSTGDVAIDGNMVTVRHHGQTFKVTLQEAAAAAGVKGVDAGAAPPAARERAAWEQALGYGAYLTAPGLARAVAEVTGLHRPMPGEQGISASPRPDPDRRVMTLEQWARLQQELEERTIFAKGAMAAELQAMRQRGARELALLDAAIERERIAATRDVARMREVGALQRQREELLARQRMQEAALQARAAEAEAERRAEAENLRMKLEAEAARAEAERQWRTAQAKADREWRERVQREQEERVFVQTEHAREAARRRALEAAREMAHLLRWSGLKTMQPVVDFARAFAR